MTTIKIDRRMTVTSPWGITRTVEEWMKAQEINEVYEIYGHWVISDYGLENLVSYYPIERGRLWEGNSGYYSWELHMSDKVWVDLPSFCAALAAARKYHARARGNS